MRKTFVVSALVCALLAAVPRASFAGFPLAKCAAAKRKAAGKKALAKAKCYSKAIKTSVGVDPVCLSTAETAFSTAWSAADTLNPPNGCAGDPAIVEGEVDACVQHLLDNLPLGAATQKCTSSKVTAAGTDALKKLICYATAAKKAGTCSTTIAQPCLFDSDCVPITTPGGTCKKCVGGETCHLTPVDPLCLSKFSTLIGTKFTAAEANGACPGTASALDSVVDTNCVSSIYPGLPDRGPGCGNNVIEPARGETCDDGNTANGDGCPASCHVDTCALPVSGTFTASVTYTHAPGVIIAGLGVFIDYPEGKVSQPTFTTPFGVSNSPNDLGYGINDEALKLSGLPSPFIHMNFRNCAGAVAPTAGEFGCTVTDASDDQGNNITDLSTLSCTVTVP